MGLDGDCARARRERWAQLFVDHHAGVLATCRAILRHHEEAEDATQEVFARVPADPDRIIDERRWLLEVARNVCIDTLRYNRRRPTVSLDAEPSPSGVADPQQAVVDRLYLGWVVGHLPVRERTVLLHQVFADEPLEQVAHRLGMSYAVAGKLAARAKRRSAAIASLPEHPVRNEMPRWASSSLVGDSISRGVDTACGTGVEATCAAA